MNCIILFFWYGLAGVSLAMCVVSPWAHHRPDAKTGEIVLATLLGGMIYVSIQTMPIWGGFSENACSHTSTFTYEVEDELVVCHKPLHAVKHYGYFICLTNSMSY